jgi:hypothetical protein
MHFEAPRGTSGKVVIPTFKEQNKSGVSYTVERLDGDRVVKVSSTWRDELFVGQDGLDGGEYRVVARYSV